LLILGVNSPPRAAGSVVAAVKKECAGGRVHYLQLVLLLEEQAPAIQRSSKSCT
jgi:hypothetical protein